MLFLLELSRWSQQPLMNRDMRALHQTQAGYFLCNDCRDKFTCRTGTPQRVMMPVPSR
jgi:hypothetical protein